jgi:MOSC domain-containing protein YiiM
MDGIFLSMIDTISSDLTAEELQSGLEHIRRSPKESGVLDLIVRRQAVNEREVLEEAELDLIQGLVGDTWNRRRSKSTPDGSPNIEMQITVISSRAAALVARQKDRWPLAGDQLYVDLDLSKENLPAGSRLALGSAVIEVTAPPHLGCQKFVARFGLEAMKFVNSQVGKELRLRGLHARVIQPGEIRTGDLARKV